MSHLQVVFMICVKKKKETSLYKMRAKMSIMECFQEHSQILDHTARIHLQHANQWHDICINCLRESMDVSQRRSLLSQQASQCYPLRVQHYHQLEQLLEYQEIMWNKILQNSDAVCGIQRPVPTYEGHKTPSFKTPLELTDKIDALDAAFCLKIEKMNLKYLNDKVLGVLSPEKKEHYNRFEKLVVAQMNRFKEVMRAQSSHFKKMYTELQQQQTGHVAAAGKEPLPPTQVRSQRNAAKAELAVKHDAIRVEAERLEAYQEDLKSKTLELEAYQEGLKNKTLEESKKEEEAWKALDSDSAVKLQIPTSVQHAVKLQIPTSVQHHRRVSDVSFASSSTTTTSDIDDPLTPMSQNDCKKTDQGRYK